MIILSAGWRHIAGGLALWLSLSLTAHAAQLVLLEAIDCPQLASDSPSACFQQSEPFPEANIENRNGLCRVGNPDLRPVNWFEVCDPFIMEGQVRVCRKLDGMKLTCGLVSAEGRVTLPALYDTVELAPGSPVARISLNGRWGFFDSEAGRILFAPQFPVAQRFSEGLAYVRSPAETGAGEGWLVNREGQRVVAIPDSVQDVGRFSGGLAKARSGSRWGYLDAEGRWKIPPQFWAASDFDNGLATVQYASFPEQWALIDAGGKGVIFLEGASHRIVAREGDRLMLETRCEVLASGERQHCQSYCLQVKPGGQDPLACGPTEETSP